MRLARSAAQDIIDRHCSNRDVVQLGFLELLEAQSDIFNACRDVDRWAQNVFPLPHGLREEERVCLAFKAQIALSLLRFAMGEYARLFDWLSFQRASPELRQRLLETRRVRIVRAARKSEALLAQRCPRESGANGSNLGFFLEVARRAECAVGAAYVQDAVHCDIPTPTPTVTMTLTPTPTRTPADQETPTAMETPQETASPVN